MCIHKEDQILVMLKWLYRMDNMSMQVKCYNTDCFLVYFNQIAGKLNKLSEKWGFENFGNLSRILSLVMQNRRKS